MLKLSIFLIAITHLSVNAATIQRFLKDLPKEELAYINPSFLASWDENKPLPQSWPCPEENSILPCTCSGVESYDIDFNCSAATTSEEIRTAFAAPFPIDRIRKLDVIHLDGPEDTITVLDEGTFSNKSFAIVTIRGTSLTQITEEVFSKSHETLLSLSLDQNKLQSFPFQALTSYTKLATLGLSRNEIPDLPQISSKSLRELYMNGNRNLAFKEDVFNLLPELQIIGLEQIDLEEIIPNLFDSQGKLIEVQLGYNKLTSIPENGINPQGENTILLLRFEENNIGDIVHDAISGLNEGAYIDFSKNKLSELDKSKWESIFSQLKNPESINLEGNPLKCGCEIYWILSDNEHKLKPTELTKCFDGTSLQQLPVEFFDKHCSS